MSASDPLGVRVPLPVGDESSSIYRLDRIPGVDQAALARRPVTTRILMESLLRHCSPERDDLATLRALAKGDDPPSSELPFFPSRVLLQDFTGIPVIVDLAAMRSAAAARGLTAKRVDPIIPVDLIVDHSVQVDSFGSLQSLRVNLDREYERNGERYGFLKWARESFGHVTIVPPGNGICHQVNLEYIASVVTRRDTKDGGELFPDTLVGTDSHTTMVNGLGVLGWGVGGIEAEAAMLGEPNFLLPPRVVGVRLDGRVPDGATATDLVLTITKALRAHGVVDRFIEFYGPGLASLSVQDRATVSNMCPEYGATSALFPIDNATLAYLRATGRSPASIARVEPYARAQGLWHEPGGPAAEFDDRLVIDLSQVVPTVAGPKNPEEAVPLTRAADSFRSALQTYRSKRPSPVAAMGDGLVHDGSVVIAAITSCTNTSNPSVMVGAGLIAQRAVRLGMKVPPYVKTSLAPGSKVVTSYLERAGLLDPLEALGFDVVGFGCTTCIGNSGPLPPEVAKEVDERGLYVAAVLSGNRNFEARIHNQVRANYLASPMLVVAYALAGRFDIDLTREPVGTSRDGRPVFLKDLWPPSEEIRALVERSLDPEMFREKYQAVTVGDAHWESLPPIRGESFPWNPDSTYLREPPYFHLPAPPTIAGASLVENARLLALLDDKVTTDHISPAGEIPIDSPAGRYLMDHGVAPPDFNTYGTRRGNHEVMIRGTFANVRLVNRLAPGTEGGVTAHQPSGARMTIYDAAERYRSERVPLIVMAGASYGQGSSRDWAAKGPMLLGVRAVVAKSFERIHRTNLVGMGVLPLEFAEKSGWSELGLTGSELLSLRLAPESRWSPRAPLELLWRTPTGQRGQAPLTLRVDSDAEMRYYAAGGILPYVLSQVVARSGGRAG